MRALILTWACLLCTNLSAQWTLSEVVKRASANYAGVQVPLEQVQEAAAGIAKARTAYLPKGEFLAQVNRATRNNVFGMLLPQSVIAPISGPPLATNAGTNVFGTATGFLISWEPFDFGFRKAKVGEAEATQARAEKAVARTKFEVEAAAAESYFTVLAADETVRNARAGVDRAQALEQIVSALARSGLRPEADAARARGEVAAAQAQWIQAEQTAQVARAALVRFTGGTPSEVIPVAGPLFSLPSQDAMSSAGAEHPAIQEQASAINEASVRRQTLDHVLYPKFEVQSALYARGTGANPDGTTGGAGAGLGPNIYNWGLGFTLTYPLFEMPALRAQKSIEAQRVRTEEARMAQLRQDLSAQAEKAKALIIGARRLAATTPLQLEAAKAGEQQARARYQAGLTSMVDVADAQRFLLQAEIDDGLARLAFWRAQLALAIAQGDLQPLLDRAAK